MGNDADSLGIEARCVVIHLTNAQYGRGGVRNVTPSDEGCKLEVAWDSGHTTIEVWFPKEQRTVRLW
jgi:hypothetical protein